MVRRPEPFDPALVREASSCVPVLHLASPGGIPGPLRSSAHDAGRRRPRNGGLDGGGRLPWVVVLPEAEDRPSRFPQGSVRVPVPRDIGGDLLGPERLVRRGRRVVLRAAVPEAPVDEDRDPWPAENQVGRAPQARQRPRIHAVSQAESMDRRAQPELRSRIPAPVRLHGPANPGRRRPGRRGIVRITLGQEHPLDRTVRVAESGEGARPFLDRATALSDPLPGGPRRAGPHSDCLRCK